MTTAADMVANLIPYLEDQVGVESAYSKTAAAAATATVAGMAYPSSLLPGLGTPGSPIDTRMLVLPSDTVASIQQQMQLYALGQNFTKDMVDTIPNIWVSKYFPATIPGGIDTLLLAVSQALVSDIQQEIIWARARSQVMRDNSRFESEIITTWASRGFSLPGGVLVNQLQEKQQTLALTIADIAAQQAIKALDIQVDGIKFAADISVKLQLGLINGFNGLIDAYSKVPIAEMNHNATMINASTAMFGAITGYYTELIRKADTENRYAIGQLGERVHVYSVDEQAYAARIREEAAIAMTTATTSANIAAAALGSLHAVGSAAAT